MAAVLVVLVACEPPLMDRDHPRMGGPTASPPSPSDEIVPKKPIPEPTGCSH